MSEIKENGEKSEPRLARSGSDRERRSFSPRGGSGVGFESSVEKALRKELEAQRQQAVAQESELVALTQTLRDFTATLEGETREFTAQRATWEAERRRLTAEISALREEKARTLRSFEEEVAALQAALNDRDSEHEAARKAAEEQLQLVEFTLEKERELARSTSEQIATALRLELEVVTRDRDALEVDLSSATASLTNERTQREYLSAQVSTLSATLEGLQAAFQDTLRGVLAARADLDAVRNERSAAAARVAALESELLTARAEAASAARAAAESASHAAEAARLAEAAESEAEARHAEIARLRPAVATTPVPRRELSTQTDGMDQPDSAARKEAEENGTLLILERLRLTTDELELCKRELFDMRDRSRDAESATTEAERERIRAEMARRAAEDRARNAEEAQVSAEQALRDAQARSLDIDARIRDFESRVRLADTAALAAEKRAAEAERERETQELRAREAEQLREVAERRLAEHVMDHSDPLSSSKQSSSKHSSGSLANRVTARSPPPRSPDGDDESRRDFDDSDAVSTPPDVLAARARLLEARVAALAESEENLLLLLGDARVQRAKADARLDEERATQQRMARELDSALKDASNMRSMLNHSDAGFDRVKPNSSQADMEAAIAEAARARHEMADLRRTVDESRAAHAQTQQELRELQDKVRTKGARKVRFRDPLENDIDAELGNPPGGAATLLPEDPAEALRQQQQQMMQQQQVMYTANGVPVAVDGYGRPVGHLPPHMMMPVGHPPGSPVMGMSMGLPMRTMGMGHPHSPVHAHSGGHMFRTIGSPRTEGPT